MGSWSYVSLPSLKTQLNEATTDYDALYREKLEEATEEIDGKCNRTFRIYVATVDLTALVGDRLLLPFDLLALTSLKTDADGDRVYENTLNVATDVDLLPRHAALNREPYWQIATAPNGLYSFPLGASGVQAGVKAGYWEALASAGTLGAAVATTSVTTVTMAAGHGIEALQTILVDSEQMYVTAVATNTLTVERGVNGTTAATHLIGATVQRYRYPSPIVGATRVLAEELLRPFGVTGRTDDTERPAMIVLPRYIDTAIEPFRRLVAA